MRDAGSREMLCDLPIICVAPEQNTYPISLMPIIHLHAEQHVPNHDYLL